MKQGTVLRIEKTSIYDGAGLRTVVYLKGCPLRCLWCSTPESQSKIIEKGFGQLMTTDQVMEEVEKDSVFFFHSGGGVTISGGEALVQADFVREILKRSQLSGINTTLETSFYVNYQEIRKVAPYLNSIYVDIKSFDNDQHRTWTGVSNKTILANIKKFSAEFPECPLHIRMPVIPTVNFDKTDILKIAQFVAPLKSVVDFELLPYHRYGLQSYQQLGIDYGLKEINTPGEEAMTDLADYLAKSVPNLSILTMSKEYRG